MGTAMNAAALVVLLGAPALALAACSEPAPAGDDDESAVSSTATSSATTAGGAHEGGAGGSAAGGQGGAPDCLMDPCERHADRLSCCADPACGWHHNTGHLNHGMPPCVSRERVCVVAGREVRECPSGTSCLLEGVFQDTENDCTLPPDMQISLLDRGICMCD